MFNPVVSLSGLIPQPRFVNVELFVESFNSFEAFNCQYNSSLMLKHQ